MSELSDLVATIPHRLKLRQSRAIAQVIDRQRAAAEAGTATEDVGYQFAVAALAIACDRTPADVEEMEGSILDLRSVVSRIMAAAGFAAGEGMPAPSPSIGDSSGSITVSPPAMDTTSPQSAK